MIIKKNSILSLDEFIDESLYNKKFGYYMKGNPFGMKGDFITAPNISELRGSGNMIGNCRCALAVTHAGCDPAYSDRRIVFNNRNSFNPEGLMDPIAFQRLPDGRVVECQMPPLQQRPPAAAPMDKEAELVLNAVDHYLLHFFKTYGG